MACGGVRSPGGCAGRAGTACTVASGVRWRARVRTPEIQAQTGSGVGLRGWRGRNYCQLTPPLRGKVNSKAVTPGAKSTGVRFRRRLTNRTNESNPQLSKACQPCTSAAHSRAAAASAAALPHARTLSLTQRLPSRTHPASCWRRLTPLARGLLHIMYCLGVHYCTTLWQTFAHNRSDAYSFCSSLQHDARPHDQGCRHPPLAPDEGDSHLQHRRAPTRRAHPLPQEEACADQDQLHPSAQAARRLLRAGQRRRRRSGAS